MARFLFLDFALLSCLDLRSAHTRRHVAGTSPCLCTHRTHVAGTVHKLVDTKRILVHFYVVAGTGFKSSAHGATLKIEVILVPASCPRNSNQLNFMQQNFFTRRACHTRKTVAATCPRFLSPRHVPLCRVTSFTSRLG